MNRPHEATTVELRVELASTREALKMAVADLQTAQAARVRERRDFRLAMIVAVLNAVIMTTLAVKYLRVVNLPKPVCLHPMHFTPTQIENAPAKLDGVEVWL